MSEFAIGMLTGAVLCFISLALGYEYALRRFGMVRSIGRVIFGTEEARD